MIRVLLAEDEPPTLRRLKRLIEQTDPDFTVVATASDGERALEALAQARPDVVFTDIRMPVLDGLQLMDAIRTRYPQCHVVVVSGYPDFSYVSHALRARSLDYLLKPVSEEAMADTLARVKQAVSQSDHLRLSQSLSAHVNRHVLDLQTKPTEGLFREDAPLGVCYLCAGVIPADDDAEMHAGAAAWEDISPEEALRATLPAGSKGFSWCFMGNTPVERILIYQTTGDSCAVAARAMHVWITGHTTLPISCGYIPDPIPLPQTGAAIRRLRRLLRASIPIGSSLCITPDDLPSDMAEPSNPATVERLAGAIRSRTLNRQSVFFSSLLDQIEREAWPQERVATLFMRAVTLLAQEGEPSPSIQPIGDLIHELLYTALSMQELEAGLACIEPSDSPDLPASGDPTGIAQTVAAYLQTHYQEHINNQTLSAAFGYVPSYISLLFRRAYGVSPAEYLTGIRLQEAKRLLARQPRMLIREVSESVGFKSQHHFSRVFKQYEGIWPTGYRPGTDVASP